MKRLGSSDSLGALMTICPTTEEQSPRNNQLYGREFQSMLDGLDEEGIVEETGHHSEKKRRLSVNQVKALEKNFEVENKLEPDRKVKLAQELGLQPRQVAVWFQNRRARWKTKQLERDYGVLKANYDALKVNYDSLQQDNEALLREIKELKQRVQGENTESDDVVSVKEEMITVEEENPLVETTIPGSDSKNNYECFNNNGVGAATSLLFHTDFKDGNSDSDSSAILNEDMNNNTSSPNNSSGVFQSSNLLLSSSSLKFNCSSSSPSPSSMNCFQFQKYQYVKMEEQNFLSADEACDFFSDEQAPTLHWYCSDEWS